jgi:CheY-like chemotaxis protein
VEVKRKASILVVDDNSSMTRTTALVLGHMGYTVDSAEDGLAAIAKVQETPTSL